MKNEKKNQRLTLKPQYKWADLSEDLQAYYLNRSILCAILVIIGVLLLIFVPVKEVSILFFIAVVFYACWKGYYLVQALYGNVLTFIGTVETKNIKEKTINGVLTKNPKYTFYGKSSLTMNVVRTDESGSNETAKFVVPISAGFEVEEGNVLIVYVLRNSVFKKNQNTYQITNPILIKVISS